MKLMLCVMVSLLLVGCGDKVPQSEAAKQVGNAPKATIDKVTADTAKAVQQSDQRARDAAD